MDLVSHFAAAITGAQGTPDPAVISEVLDRWAEPHRRYHNLDHLRAMLDVIDTWSSVAADADLVRLAAYFHDAIYDPQAAGNEEASAELSADLLARCSVPAPALDEVHRLVRLTAGHSVSPSDPNGILLADADLAVLAGDWPRYVVYAQAIRAEYAHVPDDMFTIGRTQVLRSLLALPSLYRIPELRERWEAGARTNISRELAEVLGAA